MSTSEYQILVTYVIGPYMTMLVYDSYAMLTMLTLITYLPAPRQGPSLPRIMCLCERSGKIGARQAMYKDHMSHGPV